MQQNTTSSSVTLDEVVALAKRRGFVYPGSDIYGGLANIYDYGPLGTELLRRVRELWWKTFITDRDDMVGLDTSIITHSLIWKASGHLASFADAMIDCKSCGFRTRADHLIETFTEEAGEKISVEGVSVEQMDLEVRNRSIPCPSCGKQDWTAVRSFNLLFPVKLGIVEDSASTAYLRGETAQGIFVQYKNILDSTRIKLPFGVGQLGKSFRNEITKGNFVFRTLEFEQGEIEYFFDPDSTNWESLFEDWKGKLWSFLTETLLIQSENLQWRVHSDEERSFYSKRTEDLEYRYPMGFKELWGLAYRTDYDLKQHIEHSQQDLRYYDQQANKRFIPHVIEPAVGINRLFLMLICDAYWKDDERGRTVLRFAPAVAPYRVAVFPLLANKPELVDKARSIYSDLKKVTRATWDDRGNIGKRYLAQDEIGTPSCITIDFQTLEDDTITVRDRDTATQERVSVGDLLERLKGER